MRGGEFLGHRVTNRDLNRDRPSMRCCSIEDPVSENPVDPSSAGRTRSFCEAELGDAEALHRRAPVAPARRPRGVARGQGADPAILVGFILSPHTFTSISRSFGRVGLRRWIKAPIRSRAWVRIPQGPRSVLRFAAAAGVRRAALSHFVAKCVHGREKRQSVGSAKRQQGSRTHASSPRDEGSRWSVPEWCWGRAGWI